MPYEADASGKPGGVLPKKFQQLAAGPAHDVLRRGPQGDFDQGGHFHAHAEQIGHEALHGPQRSGVRAGSPGEHFLDARRNAFLPAVQLVEHGGPLGHAAPPLPQGGQFIVADGQLPLVAGQFLLGYLPQAVVRLHVLGQLVVAQAKTVKLRGHRRDLAVEVRDAAAAAVAGGRAGGDLAFQPADLVAQDAQGPHLFELRRAVLFLFAADLVQPRHEFRQGPLALDQPLRDVAVQFLGRLDRLRGFPPLVVHVVGPGAERQDLAAVTLDLLVQVLATVPLVLDRRFLGGDPLPVGGDLGLAAADLLVDLGGLDVQGKDLRLGRLGGGQRGVAVGGQVADLVLDLRPAAR